MKKIMLVLVGLSMATTWAALQMPEIVSHRGESQDRPENSMAAYRLAFERGVDGVECDVYATTDGKGVLIHDSTTGRTAGSGTNLTVTACSWDDLKDVRIGAFGSWVGGDYEGETIPLLDDYLALLSLNDHTKCIIEMKASNNSLVSVLAAAIRAQPLATKDRVVFISFETSLISAIRTEFPDYEAWLLVSNGTYTGANLVSRIEACNATGVDINYQATVSAEDIATVKAAGYKYEVWTCDNVNTAYSLVEKGVDGITTNTGKTMKDSLAPMIAEYNNWDEIFDPDQPRGAKLWDVGDYVQNGLVGHFDGIRNAGATQVHDSTAAKWKNLVAGQPDASFALGNAAGGNWLVNGYYFNNASYAQVDSPGIALGLDCTIQLATDVDYSIQDAGTSRWPNIFSFPNDFGIYYNNNNNKGTRTSTLTWKTEPYGEGSNTRRPTMAPWNGKYITAILGNGNKYFTQNASYGTAVNRGKRSESIPVTRMTWGGSANTPSQRYSYSTIHAVRLYNRVLTEAELAQNLRVDEIRYRANGVNVIVESNVDGLEGTGGNGSYTVNGTHTFTAPASVELNGRTWAPTGYKLELWNATRLTWDLVTSANSTEFVYTNCQARAKMRLTWNWRMTQGLKRVDADDYVRAGLVQQFDGIRNAGLDQPHSSTATTWKNLSSTGGGATRNILTASRTGAWDDKGYEFKGGDYFRINAQMVLGRQATAQVACNYNEDNQIGNWPALFGGPNDRFNIYGRTKYNGDSHERGDELNFKADATTGLNLNNRPVTQPWYGRIATAILNYNSGGIGQGTSINSKAGTFGADVGRQELFIGSAGASNSDKEARMLIGRIYAVRLYDRVLTTAELAHNLEIDQVRFHVGAGRSTDTDLVEVTSELPIYKNDDFGCWIMRGAVEKTFTAPATVETANATFTCAGYRLETWNATKRQWLNAQTVANATSCTLQGTTSAANRRVTWLWTRTRALRTAADYDVSDYVQLGLIGNYDGLRNRGADRPHSSRGFCWHDLGYRDDLMVAGGSLAFDGWGANGFNFNVNGFFRMQDAIDLGQEHTVQGVLDITTSQQTTSWPNYFSVFNDYGVFTRGTGNTMELKYDDIGGGSSTATRPTSAGWTGKYINLVVTSTKMCLFEGTTIPAGKTRSKYANCDGYRWSLGAAGAMSTTDMNNRRIKGGFYAARFYNRALTEEELAQNRKVDEIRYRGTFANYCNVVVEREQPFEGATATATQADGNYEVVGDWTFTAGDYTYDQPIEDSEETEQKTLHPYCKVSFFENGEWTKPKIHKGGSYTYTAGTTMKLTWTWTPPGGTLIVIR